MKVAYRLIIYFFNFAGITNFSICGDSLNISRIMIFYNLISFPTVTYITTFFITFFYSKALNKDLVNLGSISQFSLAVIGLQAFQTVFTNVSCIYVQIWKRKKVLRIIEKCVKCSKLFNLASDAETLHKFEKKCFHTFCSTLSVIFSFHLISFFATMEVELVNIFVYSLFHWHDNIVLWFLTFISMFLRYFKYLLMSISLKLETSINSNYEELMDQFLIVSELLHEFNDVFNLLLSEGIIFMFVAITSKVDIIYVIVARKHRLT